MRNFLTYTALFAVSVVVLQLFVFDSVRVSIYFSPLPYIAFVALLPMNMRPVAVLLLGFMTGVFMDFFEGTVGLHTAAALFTAYARRWLMIVTLRRETVEAEPAMPSPKVLGGAKFMRYGSLIVAVHCLVCFSLESLTLTNYAAVVLKAVVSAPFTLLSLWAVAMLFTVRTPKRA